MPRLLRRHLPCVAGLLLLACAMSCRECTGAEVSPLTKLLVPSSTRVDFGSIYVGADARATIVLSNVGTGSVDIDAAAVDATPFAVEPLVAPAATIAAGAKQDIEVVFAPTSVGVASGVLVIANSSDNDHELTIELVGTGLAPLDCTDGNDCTDDVFDPRTGVCSNPDRGGACADGSACTENDRCFTGACVGDAVFCPAPADQCLRAVCDAAFGCDFVVDESACTDDNPCTLDRCDSVSGCDNPPVPDGTPCGVFGGCASLDVCVGGACTSFPVPDGTVCIDGDACTVDDVCTEGTCTGTQAQQEPEIAATLHSFGGEFSHVTFLTDDRLLFVDSLALEPDVAGPGALLLTAVDIEVDGDPSRVRLVKRAELVLPGGAGAVATVGPERAALLDFSGVITIVDVAAADGAITVRGILPGVVSSSDRPSLAAFADVLYVGSVYAGRVAVVDARLPDSPTLVDTISLDEAQLWDASVDETRAELLLVLADDLAGDSLRVLSLADPLAPVTRADVSVDGIFAARAVGGRIAILADSGAGVELSLRDAATLAVNTPAELQTSSVLPMTHVALSGTAVWTRSPGSVLRQALGGAPGRPLSTSALAPHATIGGGRSAYLVVRGDRAAVGGGDAASVRHYRDVLAVSSSVVLDGGGDTLRPISGPGHGSLHTLVPQAGNIYSVDAFGVQKIAVTNGVPSFVDGSSDGAFVPLLSVAGSASGTGAGSSVLVWPSSEGDPLVAWAESRRPGVGIINWGVGSVPSVGRIQIGSLLGNTNVRVRDDLLVDVIDDEAAGHLRFVIHAARIAPPDHMVLLEATAVEIAGASPAFDVHAIGIDPSLSRVAVGLNTVTDNSVAELVVLDVDGASGTTTATSGVIDAVRLHSVALDGDVVVAVESRDMLGHHVNRFGGSHLVVYKRTSAAATTLDRRGEVPLALGSHVLAFEDGTAVIATRDGIAFADVSDVDAPAIMDELALPEAPLSAVFFDDTFVVASESAVYVVSPPCPP